MSAIVLELKAFKVCDILFDWNILKLPNILFKWNACKVLYHLRVRCPQIIWYPLRVKWWTFQTSCPSRIPSKWLLSSSTEMLSMLFLWYALKLLDILFVSLPYVAFNERAEILKKCYNNVLLFRTLTNSCVKYASLFGKLSEREW